MPPHFKDEVPETNGQGTCPHAQDVDVRARQARLWAFPMPCLSLGTVPTEVQLERKNSTFDFQIFQVPYIFTLKLMNAITYLDSLGCPTERFISHFIWRFII